jgi:hypothetical protein
MKFNTNTKRTVTLYLLALPLLVLAQIPNPYFEAWDTRSVENPKNWLSSGEYSKVQGATAGSFALRLKNNAMKGQISSAMQMAFTDSGLQKPAFAINGTADSIQIQYRSNLGNDTAYIYVGLFKSGDDFPVVFQEILIHGNTTGFVTKNFGLEYIYLDPAIEADSGYMMIYSANEIEGPKSSGYLDIGSIRFKKSSTWLNNITNYNFTNWNTFNYDFPLGWTTSSAAAAEKGTSGNFTSKTSDFKTGFSALKIQAIAVTDAFGKNDTLPGYAVTVKGNSLFDLQNPEIEEPAFGLGAQNRPMAIHGYVKNTFYGGDRLFVFLNLFNSDSIVGSAVVQITQNNSAYNEFSENISWIPGFSGVADSASIGMILIDSAQEKVNDIRSFAQIDDLWFENYPVSTPKVKLDFNMIAYPNPCRDLLRVKSNLPFGSELALIGFNGVRINTVKTDMEGNASFSTENLSSGPYILRSLSTGISTQIIVIK